MQPDTPGNEHQRVSTEARILLLCVLLLAGGLRLFGLHQSAWIDEVSSISFSTGTPLEVLERLEPQHMPVFFWINSVFLWFGDSEAWLRLQSVFFGMGIVYLLFKIGVEMGQVGVGLTAAGLAAASGFLIHYSQEIRMYGLVTFFAMVGTWALLRIVRDPGPAQRRGGWIVLSCASILNLYTSPFAGFMVAIHFGVLGALSLFRSDVRFRFILCGSVVALAYIPGILHMKAMLTGTADVVGGSTPDYDSLKGMLQRSLVHFGGLIPTIGTLIEVGAMAGFVIAWRSNRVFAVITVLCVLLPIVALFVAKPGHFFNPRYLAYAQPHLLLLLAVALVWLGDRSIGRLPIRRGVLWGPVVVGIAAMLVITALTPEHELLGRKGDWKSMADGILSDLRDHDEILVEPSPAVMTLLYQLDQRSPRGRRIQLSDGSSHSWYRMFRHDWLQRRHPDDFQGPRVRVRGLENRMDLDQRPPGGGRTWLVTDKLVPQGFRRLYTMPTTSHAYSGSSGAYWSLFLRQ